MYSKCTTVAASAVSLSKSPRAVNISVCTKPYLKLGRKVSFVVNRQSKTNLVANFYCTHVNPPSPRASCFDGPR